MLAREIGNRYSRDREISDIADLCCGVRSQQSHEHFGLSKFPPLDIMLVKSFRPRNYLRFGSACLLPSKSILFNPWIISRSPDDDKKMSVLSLSTTIVGKGTSFPNINCSNSDSYTTISNRIVAMNLTNTRHSLSTLGLRTYRQNTYCPAQANRKNIFGHAEVRRTTLFISKRNYIANNNNTQDSELERCMKQDSYNVNVSASRYGVLVLPLTFVWHMVISSYLDGMPSTFLVELLINLSVLHGSWILCLYKCINQLHTSNLDPLSNLAKHWDEQAGEILSNSKKIASSALPSPGDRDKDEEETDNESEQHTFYTQEEWENARDNNKIRIRNSFDVGFFFPASLLCAIAPFVPFELDDDEFDTDEEESLYHYLKIPSEIFISQEETTTRSLYESLVLSTNGGDLTGILVDYGLIGFCFFASFLAGRRAYRCWNLVQRTPPTNLPILVYLRKCAQNDNL